MSVLPDECVWCFETPLWPTCGVGGGEPGPLAPGPLETKLNTNTLQGTSPMCPFLSTQSGPHSQAGAGTFWQRAFCPQRGEALAPSFVILNSQVQKCPPPPHT